MISASAILIGTVGVLQLVLGCVLTAFLTRYLPALINLASDVRILKAEMAEVRENIPDLYTTLHRIDKKLAVMIAIMGSRSEDKNALVAEFIAEQTSEGS